MTSHTALLEIIQDNNCPLYQLGDEFWLKGRILSLPDNKATCLIMTKVIQEFLEVYDLFIQAGTRQEAINRSPCLEINCGGEAAGCKGRIRLEYRRQENSQNDTPIDPREIEVISYGLKNFSIFSELDELSIREVVKLLNVKRFAPSETIIKAGDPGINLYIILTGEAEVLSENGLYIATLKEGDVFGEMSLISGEPIGTEVRAKHSMRVLYMDGSSFRKMLSRFSSLKMYFARLLTSRIARINLMLSEKPGPGMSGDLSEMIPSELFQIMNMHNKSGVLLLEDLSKGSASVRFREGLLIDAQYHKLQGREAFFKILTEKNGKFYFVPGNADEYQSAEPLGDFVWLLIEGMNRFDCQDH